MLLRTAVAFFVLALVTGLIGFFGSGVAQASVLQTLFFVFTSGFVVLLITGLATDRGPAG